MLILDQNITLGVNVVSNDMSIGVHYLIENVQLEGIPSSTNVDVVLSNSAYIDVTYSEPLANTLYIVSADSLQVGVSFTQPTAESVPIVYNATADSLQVGVTFSEPTAVSVAAGINYDTNLIAYYNFQNNTLDRTGNFDGVPNVAMAYAPSVVGNGGVFNGLRNVQIPNNLLLNKNLYTISVWFKATATTQSRVISFNGNGAGSCWSSIIINGGDTDGRVICSIYDGTSGSQIDLTGVVTSNMNHYLVTANLNNESNFYINNVLVGTATLGAPVQLPDNFNYIGSAREGSVPSNGELDEVGVWSEVFDQSKVTDLYDQQLAGNNIF